MVPESLIFMWQGSNASIPANWERETDLDGYYLHAAIGDTAGTTGGSANHTHTESAHYHTFTAGASSGTITKDTGVELKKPCAEVNHTHSSTNSNTATETLATANNTPSYYTVIFIKPSDANRAGVPADAWAFWDDDSTVATGWTADAAANSRLIKAAAAAADGGGTGGDNGSHTHSASAAHTHAAKNSASETGSNYRSGSDGAAAHTHSVSLNSGSGADTLSGTGFPAYDTLAIIENDTGGESLPSGLIGLYLGLIADIPANWSQKTITNGYDMLMGTGTIGNIGTTGGARTHGHTGQDHKHTPTAGAASAVVGVNTVGLSSKASAGHTHTWTIGDTTPTISDTTARQHYPSYIEVILLKYTAPVVTGTPKQVSLSPRLVRFGDEDSNPLMRGLN